MSIYYWLGALLLLPSVAWLHYGIFRVRRGNDPYCRFCGYNLKGRSIRPSMSCPECGSHIHRARWGRRYLCWPIILAALPFFGLSIWLLGNGLSERYWANLFPSEKPTGRLLEEYRSMDYKTARAAERELTKRDQGKTLTPAEIAEFDEVCSWRIEMNRLCTLMYKAEREGQYDYAGALWRKLHDMGAHLPYPEKYDQVRPDRYKEE